MRAREGAAIKGYVAMFHSPEFYNPTQVNLTLLQISAEYNISPERGDPVLENVTSRIAARSEQGRISSTEKLLAHIPDADKRKGIHIQALEQALFAWRKQATGQELTVDQETYRSNVNRLLDEINKLRTQP